MFITSFGQLRITEKGNSYIVENILGQLEVEVYDKEGKLESVKILKEQDKVRVTTRIEVL